MPVSLGIDYGTNSVRALLVDVADGRELATCVVDYPSGKQGILLDPRDAHLSHQHPGDYLLGLERSVRGALEEASKDPAFSADQVIGIGVDTTGSSPLPVDERNVPLGLHEQWKDNLAAQCWLWKDHTIMKDLIHIKETQTAR
jgi:L-ribulokinase